jgi:hypothetical protein
MYRFVQEIGSPAVAAIALILTLTNIYLSIKLWKRTNSVAFEKDRRDWIDKVIDCYCSLDKAIFNHTKIDIFKELTDICAEFSGLVDKGRFRFPNDGSRKAIGGGHRAECLETILDSHKRLKGYLRTNTAFQNFPRSQFVEDKARFLNAVPTIARIRDQIQWTGS